MKVKMLLGILCVISSVLLVSTITWAALHDRGGGLIYDDDFNITWLQDANYAYTSGYDSDGRMGWNLALGWAAALSFYDSVRETYWDDWRLPSAMKVTEDPPTGPDEGFNVSGSEMGHLYYTELGNIAYPKEGWGLKNIGPFFNIAQGNANLYYWSGTEDALHPGSAWVFSFGVGLQMDKNTKNSSRYAWAVRDGDVGAPTPIPTSILLLGSGLIGLAGLRRIFGTRLKG